MLEYLQVVGVVQVEQFAEKKGVLSEDMLTLMEMDVQWMIEWLSVHFATFENSDAFDSMRSGILRNRLRRHLGLDDRAIRLVMTVLGGRMSVAMVNGVLSNVRKTNEGPHQGCPCSPLF